jgi:hypothetical protein
MVVLALTAVVALNVWTGSPLFAVWVGSRFETHMRGEAGLTMGALAVTVVTLGLTSWLLLRILTNLQTLYFKLLGRPPRRYRTSWLRSMRAERGEWEREHNPDTHATPVEITVIVVVAAAVLAFEIWFFFYSGSSIDQRSGR